MTVEQGGLDSWKEHKVFLDLGGDDGFVDNEDGVVALKLIDADARGIIVAQPYGENKDERHDTFYPWSSIRKIVCVG